MHQLPLPSLPDHDALTAYIRSDAVSKAAAAECIHHDLFGRPAVRYPCLGPPLPNQPKVCKAVDEVQGVVCGVGGHISNSHGKGVSLATRALTHSVWLLENMRFMAIAEATKQAFALVHVLSALELARQQRLSNGFRGATADIQSILIMYDTVREWFFRTYADRGQVEAANVKAAVREYRSSIYLLNEATVKLMEAAPVPPPVAEAFKDVEQPRLVLYTFPSTTPGPLVSGDAGALLEVCRKAFAQAPAAWKAETARMLSGHTRDCNPASATHCVCDVRVPTLKVRPDTDHVSACKCCGFVGHNRHSCQHRNMATHIAVCLATLVDSTKSARITARSAHLSLYHCYHAIVAMLYRWWSSSGSWATDDWSIHGLQRLCRRGTDAPELLLRLFNHVALALKANARVGERMLLLDNRGTDTLHLEAAHNYAPSEKRRALPQTKTLKRKARTLGAEAEDDALVVATQPPPRVSAAAAAPPMSPPRVSAVRQLVERSTRVHAGLAKDLSETSEIDIGRRFGLDNIVWTELV